jgi:hypothetical protein
MWSPVMVMPYYSEYKMHILHIFPIETEVYLKFMELFTSLQTNHQVACKELNINTFRVSHQATPFPCL